VGHRQDTVQFVTGRRPGARGGDGRHLAHQLIHRHAEHICQPHDDGERGELEAPLDLVEVVGRDAGQSSHDGLGPVGGRPVEPDPFSDTACKLLVHVASTGRRGLTSAKATQHRYSTTE
jgi:hypothetical protein